MQQPAGGNQCPFCQLAENPEQTFDVHESEHFRAWLDINPRARGHTMIVPNDHITGLDDLGPDLTAELFDVVRIVAEKARSGLGADGVSIVMNDGEAAGQQLDHFYTQVFPRFAGEDNEGAPAGAVFQPLEDVDENTLQELAATMQDASYTQKRSSVDAPGAALTQRNRGSEGEDGDVVDDQGGDDEDWDADDPAEFR